jgi:hypothetical protein
MTEILKGKTAMAGQPGDILILANNPPLDQNLVCPEADSDRSRFRSREDAGRPDAAQTVEFEGVVRGGPDVPVRRAGGTWRRGWKGFEGCGTFVAVATAG